LLQLRSLNQARNINDLRNPPSNHLEALGGNRKGQRRITADTALRLARYFNMTPQYWLGLQADYDLDIAQDELEEKINREVRPSPSFAA
jgi:plasmid maintenance system antidote protein VapI